MVSSSITTIAAAAAFALPYLVSAGPVPNFESRTSSDDDTASALPSFRFGGGFSVPLAHTSSSVRRHEGEEGFLDLWSRQEAARIERKYMGFIARHEGVSVSSIQKRDGSATIQDISVDASYAGTVSIGTPAQTFTLILDTGSADIWVAGSDCVASVCSGLTTYTASSSSTFQNQTSAEQFEISYGSGDAIGYTATETISLASQAVTGQVFDVVTNLDSGLITAPISGIMGFGFQGLSVTDAKSWWQNLASSWTNPLFAFKLNRYRGSTGRITNVEANGGAINFGAVNTSAYTGSINYVAVTDLDYWQIPCLGMTVQGTTIDISTTTASTSSSGSTTSVANPAVAIDTGTTLVSVPSATAAKVYAAISGSSQISNTGYYQYPCTTNVNVTLNFGGISYAISNADFNLGQVSTGSSMCEGAIYGSNLGSRSIIQWIVGATFLKNVYSVYEMTSTTTAQVGFAALADGSTQLSGTSTSSNVSSSGSPTGTGSGTSTTAQASSATTTRASGAQLTATFGVVAVVAAVSAIGGLML